MPLPVRSFSDYVQDMAAALQAGSRYLLDLSPGSVLRALLEAQASVMLWLQVLIADTLEASRAGTARGADLDAWMADFSIVRMPATRAVGAVTLSRTSSVGSVTIPVNTRVRTTATGAIFAVTADSGHPGWQPESSSYLMREGLDSITVPVVAEQEGVSGNVLAGAISLLSSSVAGVDTVSNDQPTVGGLEAESDASLRRRFIDYLGSLSKATPDAVAFAIQSVRQGLLYRIYEGVDVLGTPRSGHFVVVIDDGSRALSDHTVMEVAKMVEAVRPIGCTFSVTPPTTVECDVTCAVAVAQVATGEAAQIKSAAAQAVRRYMLQLGIGDMVPVTKIAQIIYSADERIENVSNLLINGSGSDVSPGPRGAILPRLIAVS